MSKYFTCPNCHADVPINALACPECGSDRETGWSEEAQYVHLLPDKGDEETDISRSMTGQKYSMAAIALVVVVAFLVAAGLGWTLYLIPFIAVGAVITYVNRRYASSPSGLQRQLYQQLLARAGGDRKMADRLIEYERERYPDSNRLQLLQNAIYRWDRDRR